MLFGGQPVFADADVDRERRVEVVLDVGLASLEEDPAFRHAVEDLERALHPPQVEEFVAALAALGPVLEARAPRADDDVDELPNELRLS